MTKTENKPQASFRVSVAACLFYAFVSIGITFFNKIVLSTYKFKWPNIMTMAQMIFSLFFLATMKKLGYIAYPGLTKETSIKTSPLSISFLGTVLTGLGALKYLNIPMFNSLRRLTTLITMGGEYWLLGKKESISVQLSVWLMVMGAMIAGLWDFDYSFIGYFLVLLNCLFTAIFLLSIAKFGKQGLDQFGLMYYNNVQSLPIVFLICYFNGDFDSKTGVFAYEYLYALDFWFYFILQSATAFLLNYTIFLCTNINSALATSVTGQIKNIATTAGGYVAFGDVTYSTLNVIGLLVGVVASSWYSYLKYVESETSKKSTILPSTSNSHNNNASKAAALASPLLTSNISSTDDESSYNTKET